MWRRILLITSFVALLLLACGAAWLGYNLPIGDRYSRYYSMPSWTLTGSISAAVILLTCLIFRKWWRVLITTASALLLLATCLFWGRSYASWDMNVYWSDITSDQCHGLWLNYSAGHAILHTDSYYFPASERATFIADAFPGKPVPALYRNTSPFATMNPPTKALATSNFGVPSFNYSQEFRSDIWGIIGLRFVRRMIYFPFWMPALIFSLLPIVVTIRWRALFRHSDTDERLCSQCGYDLRAHNAGTRCPECGHAVPPLDAAATRR